MQSAFKNCLNNLLLKQQKKTDKICDFCKKRLFLNGCHGNSYHSNQVKVAWQLILSRAILNFMDGSY